MERKDEGRLIHMKTRTETGRGEQGMALRMEDTWYS